MRAERVLVVGGSGFIGAPIMEELTTNGLKVFGTSFRKSKSLIQFDILARESWSEIINLYKPTTVISTAWETEHQEYWTKSSNYDYMEATLGFAKECFQNSVSRFIGLGTSSEYGYSPGACNKDTSSLNPFGFYSECKADTGIRLRELSNSYGKTSHWIRIFQPFGPKERYERLIPRLMKSIYDKQRTEISYPLHMLDFTYSKTIANGIFHILQNNLDHFVDLGAGEPRSVQKIAEDIVGFFNRDLALLRMGDDCNNERLCFVDRASEIFSSGWKPKDTTKDSLKHHCEDYLRFVNLQTGPART